MSIKAALIDLDGTVYRGDELIDGAKSTIDYLKSKGIRVIFCTNNSGSSRKKISDKLNRMGIDCDEGMVMSSGYAAAQYVSRNGFGNVFVSGTDDLKNEFESAGICPVSSDKAETTVIGMDSTFDYRKMVDALNAALRSKTLIVCNLDKTFPKENNVLYPGCGGMVAPIVFCSGKEIDQIIGKPNTIMVDIVKRAYGLESSQMVVIGDSYSSDIEMAKRASAKYVLIGKHPECDCCVGSISEVPEAIEKMF